MAIRSRRLPMGLIHHSDRGVQYACGDYRKLLRLHGIKASMSRKGNCLDNAPMESFFGSLKTELVHRTRFSTRREARAALFEYIEIFYNQRRRHSEVYSSHLTEWQRRARREGSLQGLTPSKRGRKPAERNPLSAKVHELEAKVARLEKELHTAHTILDVQGKVAGLLGFSLEHGKDC